MHEMLSFLQRRTPRSGTARRPAKAETNSERDPIADILCDLDRVRAEALEAVQAADALREAKDARKGRGAGPVPGVAGRASRAYVVLWWLMVLGAWCLVAVMWLQDLTDPHLPTDEVLFDNVPLTVTGGVLPIVALATLRWAITGQWRWGWRL